MKSLLLIAALLGAPVLARAQMAAPLPSSPAATSGTAVIHRAPPAASSGTGASTAGPGIPDLPAQPAGTTHDAATNVPLPGQPSAGPTLEKNIPLIPDNVPKTASSGGSSGSNDKKNANKPKSTFETEEDLRLGIKMREAETRALNDPRIQDDWAAAHHTRTDPERRTLLAVYYNHLFDLMIKLDPSIKEKANLRRSSAIARMKYARLYGADENPLGANDATGNPVGTTGPVDDSEGSGVNPPVTGVGGDSQ